MALVKKIMTEAQIATEATVKKESKIARAAKVLTESGLATRCPALAKMMESSNKAEKYNAAVMTTILENTNAMVQQNYKMPALNLFKEDVTTSAASLMPGVASLTPRVVDIVNVFYPKMVAHYIADIQALDRQTGEIFVIKTRYGMTAAGVAEGDIIFEKPTDGSYSSEWLTYTPVEAAATELTLDVVADTSFAPNPASIPEAKYQVRAGSVRVMLGGKTIASDYGTGQIVGKGVLSTSTVNYTTGQIKLTLDGTVYKDAIDNKVQVSAKASRDTEINDDTIRTIEFDVLNQSVRAEEHPLMSSYSVASALVANAHMALDVDELISNQLAGTIRWERDLALIRKVAGAAAKEPTLAFDCQANGQNLTLKQRYSSYDVFVSAARGLIQEKMGRGTVEYIIVSATQGLTIVEQIEGFVASPEGKKPVGPYLAGTLRDGTISVIAVPYTSGANNPMAEDEIIFGFKGFQLGDSAIVVAEFVPLYFTPTFQAPNLKNHKGCLSFYDMIVNNPKYLVKGEIDNFNLA
jgi:hypothetical protein